MTEGFFPPEEYEARVRDVRERMRAHDLDALLLQRHHRLVDEAVLLAVEVLGRQPARDRCEERRVDQYRRENRALGFLAVRQGLLGLRERVEHGHRNW